MVTFFMIKTEKVLVLSLYHFFFMINENNITFLLANIDRFLLNNVLVDTFLFRYFGFQTIYM